MYEIINGVKFIKYERCNLITEGGAKAVRQVSVHEASGVAEGLSRLPALETERVRRTIRLELCLEYMSHADVDMFTECSLICDVRKVLLRIGNLHSL